MEEILEMSNKELERYRILSEIKNKQLSQIKGAKLLNLSTRQIRNLLNKFNKEGAKSLISKKRNRRSNRSYKTEFKKKILDLIQLKYEDFGPTLICEKLEEQYQIIVSNET